MVVRAKKLLTLAVLSGLGLVGFARAQGVPAVTDGKMYTNKQQFRLPFHLEEKERQRLREVQLYVKGPNEPWAFKETTLPTQAQFIFRAPLDGEYLFNIVTVDKSGRATPADVTQEAPALVVVVDTTPPDVYVSLPPAPARASGEDMIRVSVREGSPAAPSIKAEYQTPDRNWQLLAPAGAPDQFRCPAPAEWSGLVRVTVTDRAGNVTVREVGGASAEPVASRPVAEPPAPASSPQPPVPSPVAANVPEPVHSTSMRPTATAPPAPAPAAPEPQPTAGQRAVVNGPVAQLEYKIDQVGASGVGKVEVWVTADDGKNWQKLCDDPDRASPVEVRLPGEGVYGVSVVVTNGNGVGDPPPAPGTLPDWWVEIDSTKPAAQLLSVRPGQGEDAGHLIVSWSASDKNLGPEPVSLYCATKKDGPWQPLARGLKNEGQYRWAVPRDAGAEFFVRIDVTDRAGHTTRCDSPQAVVMDLSRPRARVLGITSSVVRAAATAPPSGN